MLLLALAGATPVAAQTADQVRTALAEVLREGDLQQRLPSGDLAPAAPARGARPAPREPGTVLHLALPPALTWLLLALGLACGLVLLTRGLGDWRSGSSRRPTAPPPAPSAAVVPPPAAPAPPADALAAEGRLAEAVHRLLLDALDLLRRRGGVDLAPSLTAREILDRVRLSPPEGAALGLLIGQVERCWFGRAQPSLDDYRRCRDGLDRLRGGVAA